MQLQNKQTNKQTKTATKNLDFCIIYLIYSSVGVWTTLVVKSLEVIEILCGFIKVTILFSLIILWKENTNILHKQNNVQRLQLFVLLIKPPIWPLC